MSRAACARPAPTLGRRQVLPMPVGFAAGEGNTPLNPLRRFAQGVNIMAFCKEYNAKTADKAGQIIPVAITVYDVRHCALGRVLHSVCIFGFMCAAISSSLAVADAL